MFLLNIPYEGFLGLLGYFSLTDSERTSKEPIDVNRVQIDRHIHSLQRSISKEFIDLAKKIPSKPVAVEPIFSEDFDRNFFDLTAESSIELFSLSSDLDKQVFDSRLDKIKQISLRLKITRIEPQQRRMQLIKEIGEVVDFIYKRRGDWSIDEAHSFETFTISYNSQYRQVFLETPRLIIDFDSYFEAHNLYGQIPRKAFRDMVSILSYHKDYLIKRARDLQCDLYFPSTVLNLARSFTVKREKSIWIHYNKKYPRSLTHASVEGDCCIGSGSTKVVTHCFNIETGEIQASSSIRKRYRGIREIRNHLSFQKALGDDCVKLYGAVVYQDKVRIQTERVWGKELLNYLDAEVSGSSSREPPLSFNEKKRVVEWLVRLLVLLEDHHLLYRDFKGENILISRERDGSIRPKLIDFGYSCRDDDEEKINNKCGTFGYVPPEFQGRASAKNDVWAVGVLIVLLFYSEIGYFLPPQPSKNDSTESYLLRLQAYQEQIEPLDSRSLQYLVWGMLRADPSLRFSPRQVLRSFNSLAW